MNNMSVIAAILLIWWAIGFFALASGAITHVLLIFALLAFNLRGLEGKKG